MPRLPKIHSHEDRNRWGHVLNEFLLVAHDQAGNVINIDISLLTNFYLTSPNGTRYRLEVTNEGALTTTPV